MSSLRGMGQTTVRDKGDKKINKNKVIILPEFTVAGCGRTAKEIKWT